ncbi:hypothetical protein cypCar_00047146 [Cyprinus carpio]|nr:hypothetical protein cypCar_00047146 [Cyprinus carpio]
MMYEHAKGLFSNELLLTQMEKCALMEALILVSNQFKDYNKQKAFLKELIAPVTAQWLSEEMRSVLWDPATFLAYVGADQVISDLDTEDQMGINRTQNSLFLPENINRLSKTFSRVYDIMDVEKNFALGIPQPVLDAYDSSAYRNIVERMQGFFSSLYDNWLEQSI